METLVRRSAARGGAEWACGRRPGAAVPAGATRPPAPRALGEGGGAGCACLSYLPEGWGTWRETAPLAEPPCPTVVGPAHMADPPPPSSSPPGFPFPTSGLCRKWPVPPLPAARAAPPPPPRACMAHHRHLPGARCPPELPTRSVSESHPARRWWSGVSPLGDRCRWLWAPSPGHVGGWGAQGPDGASWAWESWSGGAVAAGNPGGCRPLHGQQANDRQ